jgi:uncharacterized protein (UPF0332 family)
MNEEVSRLLAKAERSITAAGTLLRAGDTDFAASRAYYAIFYTAEALILSRGLTFSKHTGVHAAFGKHFAKPAVLDPKYHRWLLEAFAARIAGDYDVDVVLEIEDVEETIRRAEDFLRVARDHVHDMVDGE